MAFLKREYAVLGAFALISFAVLWIFIDADVLDRIPATPGPCQRRQFPTWQGRWPRGWRDT